MTDVSNKFSCAAGWNKISQVSHADSLGLSFVVHPSGFILHRPHSFTRAKSEKFAYLKRRNFEGTIIKKPEKQMQALYHHVLRQQNKTFYTTVVDDVIDACRFELPWWKQYSTPPMAVRH